jgi:Tol biopolymer transport system component
MNSPTLTAAGTQLGVILGTAAYMAPEQAKGRPVDKRADVWAFGALLHEMLTGARLFAGETVPETLAGVLRQEVDFAALPVDTPQRLRALLRRCLERDPKNRLRDIGEARIALDPAVLFAVEAPVAAGGAAPWSTGRRSALVGGAVVLVLLGMLAGRALRRSPEVPRATRSVLELPTGWAVDSLNRSLAFSPDGRQLAIAVTKGGRGGESRLLLRTLDHLEARPLDGTAGASYPFWSPDGQSIGFFADGKLKRLEVESGSVRTICDAPSGRGASWSPRGTIVFAPVASGALAEVAAGGGTPTRVACAADAECVQRLPQYLPDGRRALFYWERENASSPSGVYLWDPDQPEPRIVLAGETEAVYVSPGFIAFVREKNLLVQPFDAERLETSGEAKPLAGNVSFNPLRRTGPYAFSPLGDLAYQTAPGEPSRQLAWFDGTGKMLAPIGEPGAYQTLDPSPDGRRAAAILGTDIGSPSAWLVDLERGLRTALSLGGSIPEATFGWSPDGKGLAVALAAERKIVVLDLDGGAAPREVFTRANTEVTSPMYLPDASGLLFSARSNVGDKQSDVLLLSFAEGAVARPLLTGPANEQALSFSPDGRWLLYRSAVPSRRELYVAAFPNVARKWLLATDTTDTAAWRSNNEVLYANAEGDFFSIALQQRGEALEAAPPRPALGTLRLADRVRLAVYVRAGDRLLVASDVGEAEQAPLVLVSGWRAALGR